MSLDYNTADLDPDLRAEFFPPDERGKMANHLHAAIFATMPVGIGQVTKLNYREFYMRQLIWCKAVGPLFNERVEAGLPHPEWSPIILTLDECRALVGLHTNASPKTRAQFNADLWNTIDGQTQRPPIPNATIHQS